MLTKIVVASATKDAERALVAAAASMQDVRVDVAADANKLAAALADPLTDVDAIVLGPVENAPDVTETSLIKSGRVTVHWLGAELSNASARALLETIHGAVQARGARQEQLLAIVAHDVRAPLGVALGAVAEMTHPTVGQLTSEQRTLMRLVKRSLDRLSRLSTNVSQLARIEARRLTLARARTDMAALAREVVERTQRDEELDTKRIVLRASAAFAQVDREKLGLAVENVLMNAVRFARSEIHVTVAREGSHAIVVLEDDGPGLPAGVPDIFDPLRAAQKASGTTGSGLGLAVVRGLLVAHGGDARAETIVSGGARFTLRVPAVD